jgi:hypothetical protein
VSFSATLNSYTVTPSGTNVTISPSSPVSVNYGSTAAFTVTANSGYIRSSSVGGTCPAGSWSGSVYTTGAITSSCTVTFSATGTSYTASWVVASTSGWGTGGCGTATERGTTTSGDALQASWTDTRGASTATVTLNMNWKFYCSPSSYTVTINGVSYGAGTLPAASCVCNGTPFATTSQTFTGVAINAGGTNTIRLTETTGGYSWIGVLDYNGYAFQVTVQ